MAASQAMLKPSRSGVNRPSFPSRLLNAPANQKKYTSHTASPRAKRTLNPATDRWLLRIACLLRGLERIQFRRKLDALRSFCVAAFSDGKPVPTPDRVRGKLFPENALPSLPYPTSSLAVEGLDFVPPVRIPRGESPGSNRTIGGILHSAAEGAAVSQRGDCDAASAPVGKRGAAGSSRGAGDRGARLYRRRPRAARPVPGDYRNWTRLGPHGRARAAVSRRRARSRLRRRAAAARLRGGPRHRSGRGRPRA